MRLFGFRDFEVWWEDSDWFFTRNEYYHFVVHVGCLGVAWYR